MEEQKLQRQGEALLEWYESSARDLPWRREPSPYHVWLSEIMLQQTRVEAVRGYYERFLSVLPDIRSLAEAPEEVYLKLWEGLGYYSRVRNLHRAAEKIIREHDGQMPRSSKELLQLPGIGPYTAAAIASIAFGERIPAVDGNLLRVFARVTADPRPVKDPAVKRDAAAWYLPRMPEERPGDFNQAMMDLGATVCVPKGTPLCGSCPWAAACEAHARGQEQDFPRPAPRPQRRIVQLSVLLIRDEQRILLHKRPDRGLLAGLWEFPCVPGHLQEREVSEAVRKLGFLPLHVRSLPPARHIFTHREWEMRGFEVRADELAGSVPPAGYVLADIEQIREVYPIPSAFAAYRKILLEE